MREGGRESDGRLAGAADAAVALLSQSVSRTLTTHTFATFASRGEQKSLRQVTIISKRPPEGGGKGGGRPAPRSPTRSLALHFVARSQARGAEPRLRRFVRLRESAERPPRPARARFDFFTRAFLRFFALCVRKINGMHGMGVCF